jgi:hypothetical protein
MAGKIIVAILDNTSNIGARASITCTNISCAFSKAALNFS